MKYQLALHLFISYKINAIWKLIISQEIQAVSVMKILHGEKLMSQAVTVDQFMELRYDVHYTLVAMKYFDVIVQMSDTISLLHIG